MGCFALAFSTRHVLRRTLTGLHDLQAVAALNAFLLVYTMAQTGHKLGTNLFKFQNTNLSSSTLSNLHSSCIRLFEGIDMDTALESQARPSNVNNVNTRVNTRS